MPDAKLIRVLVVDDSAFNRRTISEIIEGSENATVVGVARDGEEGIKKAFETRPDLITLDLEMPRMDGFTFLRIIMKSLPTPVVVISSRSEDKNVFKALELGAIDFLAKSESLFQSPDSLRSEILGKLTMVRELKLRNVQRHLSRVAVPQAEWVPPLSEAAAISHPATTVLIGASTGGPSALQAVLSALPQNLDACVLISQHMPAGFTKAFAERLDRNSPLRVKEAEDGDVLESGVVLVAPGGKNLLARKRGDRAVAILAERGAEDKYVPSVNALFISGAAAFADKSLAVVLTGMGNDGAEGVVAIKEAGGQVLAESEKTSIVFGMPREAIKTRKVDEVLNLEDVPRGILRRCRIR